MLDGMNVLDCWALLSISCSMIAGFTFISDIPITREAENFVVVCLLIITSSMLAMSVIFVWQDYKDTNTTTWKHRALTNITVGAWWKASLGVNANLELSEFFDTIGGRSSEDVTLQALEELMSRANVTDVLGEGIAHLMQLVLDENHDGALSSEEIYQHLWMLPGTVASPHESDRSLLSVAASRACSSVEKPKARCWAT